MSVRVDRSFPILQDNAVSTRLSFPNPAGSWCPSKPGEPALWLLHGFTEDWEVFKTLIYF